MSTQKTVTIQLYRGDGTKDTDHCQESEMLAIILQQLLSGPFHEKPVAVHISPWPENQTWEAPVVMMNGKVFSQGIVPDGQHLVRRVGELLEDQELIRESGKYTLKTTAPPEREGMTVYFSPACPHCNQLTSFLEANQIPYTHKNVMESEAARAELKGITGKMTIPVIMIGREIIVGFDKSRIRNLLRLDSEREQDGQYLAEQRHPTVDSQQLRTALETAKQVLASNNYEGKTRASQHLYPHQWNWDAGFIARGYLHYAPERAYTEIRSLFSGQWSDGFLPHIIFNPQYLEHFPGPDYWKAERSGRIPKGIYTSGISQPAVHASMLCPAANLDPERDRAVHFLREMYPKLKALHDFYFTFRDPTGEGLVCLVHPWESGVDNAPIWDEALANVIDSSPWAREMQHIYDELAQKGKRPKRTYIEKYSYLVESLFVPNYEWKAIMAEHPFLIQDVLFNAVLCRAEKDLAKICETIGRDPQLHEQRAQKMADAINKKLWNQEAGLYYSYDLRAGKPIERDTIFCYVPLFAEICSHDQAKVLIDNLRSHCYCIADKNCVGIPSYDMCQADFNGEFYWRGPIWFNICWYMVHGLRTFGEEALAEWLETSLLRLVVDHGCYEYYEPDSGRGLGADGFSWTAALFIDLAMAHM